MSNEFDIVGDLLSPMLAAFLGAWAAFRLEAHRDRVRTQKAQAGALREAVFALAQQRTFLRLLDAQALAPYRDNPDRAFLLLPHDGSAPAYPLNLPSLDFILESGAPDLLNALALADSRFRTVELILARRNRLHIEMQEKLESNAGSVRDGTIEDVQGFVGPRLTTSLRSFTDQLYDMTTRAIAANGEVLAALQKFGKERYPKAALVTFADLPV